MKKWLRSIHRFLASLLFLPVEHTPPNQPQKPYVTLGIGFILLIVFGLGRYFQWDLVRLLAFFPVKPENNYYLNFIASLFVHLNIFHLMGNVYFFSIFADNVEEHLGSKRLLLLFFAAGIAGNIGHWFFDVRRVVGASGAISGIIAYYCLQFPKTLLGRSFFLRYLHIPFPAYLGFIAWLVLQIYDANKQFNRVIADSAISHLVGAVVGVMFFAYYKFKERKA